MMLILPIYGIQNDLLGKQQRQLAQVCTVCALSPTRWTIFRLGMTLAPLTLTLSHKGRGDQNTGHRGLRGVEGKGTNKNRSLELRFLFLFPKHFCTQFFPPCTALPFQRKKAVNMHAKATGGHGIGSPCKPPSRVQRVRSAIRDDGAAAAGTGMCRLRRSVRPVGRDEGTREAGGLPGEKTFGDFGSFQSHSPSRAAAAKPRRGRSPRVLHGEAMPFRLAIFRYAMTLPTPSP